MAEPLISKDTADDWKLFLRKWEEEVYKVAFEPAGISKDAALIVWFQNKTHNLIDDYIEKQEAEMSEDDEPWRDG
jgi:hypothetical protein